MGLPKGFSLSIISFDPVKKIGVEMQGEKNSNWKEEYTPYK